MKISTKIGSSFLLLSLFMLIGGVAGYYGINKLGHSLKFITGNAWYAANGAMESVMGIKGQMIALERLISKTEIVDETQHTALQQLLQSEKVFTLAALEQMKNSGLMVESELAVLNTKLPIFTASQNDVLTAHEIYRQTHLKLEKNQLDFLQLITLVEEFVYTVDDTINNKSEVFELKHAIIDDIEEIHRALLERFYLFEALVVEERAQDEILALDNILLQLEESISRLLRYPYFKTVVEPRRQRTYEVLLKSALAQHKQDFAAAIEKFKQFKQTKQTYFAAADALLGILDQVNQIGDNKVIAEIGPMTTIRQLTTIIVLAIIFIVFILAIAVSLNLIKSISRPLIQTRDQLKALAQGKVVQKNIRCHRGSDEITEIVRSTCQLKVSMKNIIEQANAIANGDYNKEVKLLSESDQLGKALIKMTCTLREVTVANTKENWLKTGQTQLNEKLSGEQDITSLAKNIITFLANYLEIEVGLFYLLEEETDNPYLKLTASYAYKQNDMPATFLVGEGMIGQVALERKMRIRQRKPTESSAIIQSSLAKIAPPYVLWIPFLYENHVKGVIELGATEALTEIQQHFLQQVMPNIGIAMNTALSRQKMQSLLQQTQVQAEQLKTQTATLQIQKEQMQQINEELQTQAEELKSQQEELRQTNEELETRSLDLEQQKNEIHQKNLALEHIQAEMQQAKEALEVKARELELASQYKSEFLANMSHELRTPLNSLLILAQILAENKSQNLTEKQQEYARTIHSSGNELLALVNDILDLSKVEAGQMEVHAETISLTDLVEIIATKFRSMAEKKGLNFQITLAPDLPSTLQVDIQRLRQIINNLLSNAFKFTQQGQVTLTIQRPFDTTLETHFDPHKALAISVTDTGIGIPKDKQKLIFEAFQQVDGTTSRRYGGTGLGLSISRQLTKLLGGELHLSSEVDRGSTFTLIVPETPLSEPAAQPISQPVQPTTTEITTPTLEPLADDRDTLQPSDKCLLIIEDDRNFIKLLIDLAREKGFKCLAAEDGKTGLQLVNNYCPQAIILDVNLPKIDGWSVMEKLKNNPEHRHIPVHFISATDQSLEARKMGAIGYLLKPVNMVQLGQAFKKIEQFMAKTVKKLLIFADIETRRQKILALAGDETIQSTQVDTTAEAYQVITKETFDCLILDVEAEQGKAIYLLEQLKNQESLSQVPVIVYADRELTPAEEKLLQHCTATLTVKAVQSPERLLDEATLFLHQIEAHLPQEKQQMLQAVHDRSAILTGKKVLIVDDDIRNTFALATILEDKNMEVFIAKNGQEALKSLTQQPDTDIVLMDIMMPEMDGYEAIRQIRVQECFRKLPVIALTAKAMKGDKTKCIEAGASDYLAKPVDTDKLISLMRVWLYR